MSSKKLGYTLLLILCAGAFSGAQNCDGAAGTPPPFKQPSFKKMMIVILENEDQAKAIDQPFMKALAAKSAFLNNYKAVTHPSQPNYIALTSGDLNGVKSDSNYTIDVKHLGDLLEEKGLSWKTYAENFPGNCELDARIGAYARKHNPFISYKNVQTNPERCAKIVNSSVMYQDIAAGTLPDFSLYIPDMNNDGHDTGVAFADKWLQTTFGPLLDDPRFMKDMLFVVTFDEGRIIGSNKIYTAFYGDSVTPGVSEFAWNHYDLLRTIEDSFQLGNLGKKDSTASPISGVWK